MLVKRELMTVQLQEYPKVPRSVKRELVAAAKKVELARSGEVLVIDIFNRKRKAFELRFVSDGKSSLLCTEWPAEEWTFRQPAYVLGFRYHYGEYIWALEKDESLVYEFFGNPWHEKGILDAIRSFVDGIYEEKREKERDRKYGKRQEHFAMYPDYPDDLAEYCDRYAFPHTWIFISKIESGKRRAFCGFCRKRFKVDKSVRSGSLGECPKCKLAAKYRWEWLNVAPTDKIKICIAARVDGQELLRWVNVERQVSVDKKLCSHKFEDYFYNLHLNTNKGTVVYSYSYSLIIYYGRQWSRKKNGIVNYEKTHVYANNLSEVYGNPYRHVDLEAGLRGAGEVCFETLLENLLMKPETEYLFKFGLISLAGSSYIREINGRNFSDALGVKKQIFPMLCRQNATWHEIQAVKAAGGWVSDEMLEKFRELRLERDFSNVVALMQTMSFEKFVNYFANQRKIEKKLKATKQILQWYKDYINTCNELEVDLARKSVRFPKNLKEAHDRIVERYNSVKYEAEEKHLALAKEKLYGGMEEFAKNGYLIVFPLKRSDFIKEGQSLNHCVGTESYFTNHVEGTRMVFFVREFENPDKPFYTLEVDMRELRIQQLYGFGDSSAAKEVRSFANDFVRGLKPAA